MTQKSVEILIGKLASDVELRGRFRRSGRETLRAMQESGLELTALEIEALAGVDVSAFERLAGALDPRLQKASLKPTRRQVTR